MTHATTWVNLENMLSGRSRTKSAVCASTYMECPGNAKWASLGGTQTPKGWEGPIEVGLGWVVATPGAPTPSPDGDCPCLASLESLEQEPRLGLPGREEGAAPGGAGHKAHPGLSQWVCPQHLPPPTRSGQSGPCTFSPSPHLCLAVPGIGWSREGGATPSPLSPAQCSGMQI